MILHGMLNTNMDANVMTVSVVQTVVKSNVHPQVIHLEEKVMKWDVTALVVVHVIIQLVYVHVSLDITVQCVKHKLY